MVCVDHPRDIPESLDIKLKRFFKARKMCWKRVQQYSSWLTYFIHLGMILMGRHRIASLVGIMA
jgi:hypothetical protein